VRRSWFPPRSKVVSEIPAHQAAVESALREAVAFHGKKHMGELRVRFVPGVRQFYYAPLRRNVWAVEYSRGWCGGYTVGGLSKQRVTIVTDPRSGAYPREFLLHEMSEVLGAIYGFDPHDKGGVGVGF
jgi:hypothetical protein